MEKQATLPTEKTTCKGCYMYTICDMRKGGYAPALRTCHIETNPKNKKI